MILQKRRFLFLTALLMVSAVLWPAEGSRFSVKLAAGWGRLQMGDYSDWIDSQNRYWASFSQTFGYSLAGAFQPVHGSFDLSAELDFKLGERFSLGIGTGYIQSNGGEQKFDMAKFNLTNRNLAESSLSAVPVLASVRYSLPLAPRLSLSVHLGLGYYFSQWKLKTGFEQIRLGETINQTRTDIRVSGGGIGFHGGTGLEWRLSRRFSLLVEASCRYLSIGHYTGDSTFTTTAASSTKTGILYFYNREIDANLFLKYLNVFDQEDIDSKQAEDREAEADLSGYAIRVGLVIAL